MQTNGKTYEDLCIKQTDGVSCEQNSRAVTRFWYDDYETYEVRAQVHFNIHYVACCSTAGNAIANATEECNTCFDTQPLRRNYISVTALSCRQGSVTSDADVLEAINVDTYPDGTSVSLEAVFGNTLEYDSEGSVISASAMTQVT